MTRKFKMTIRKYVVFETYPVLQKQMPYHLTIWSVRRHYQNSSLKLSMIFPWANRKREDDQQEWTNYRS